MSPLANLIFYDIESSGLDVCFDQILQFYACRLDAEGDIAEECHIEVKGLIDCVPDVAATKVHKLVPSFDHGLSEFDALVRIHQFLNTPRCKNGGYNTLGFDDEFLRFSFYRNFLNPYQHQWAQQCSRFDIFPIVALFAVMAPDVMNWPITDGRLSLKLEDLNQANGWLTGQAHDASFDVHVTKKCAQVLADDQERFNYAMGYFIKDIDKQRVENHCDRYCHMPYALLFDPRFSYRNQFMKPALFLGYHAVYSNQSMWLLLDEPLWDLQDDKPIENRVYRKKLAEAPFVLPPKEQYTDKIGDRFVIAQENLAWLAINASVLKKLSSCLFKNYDEQENVDVDAQLYQLGLISQKQIDDQFAFTQASSDQRRHTLAHASGSFKSRSLRFCMRHDSAVWVENMTDDCCQYRDYLLGESDHIVMNHRQKAKRQLPAMIAAVKEELAHGPDCDREIMKALKEQLYRQKKDLEKTTVC